MAFRYEEDSGLMMASWSPKFKNQSDDESVSTILAQHLDKDFLSAQPFPATAHDAKIHSRVVMCGRLQNDPWISYLMGELLDKQSNFPSSSSSSSFMTEILKSVDRAPLSLDIVNSTQSSSSSPENATSSLPPPHDFGVQCRAGSESAVNIFGEGSASNSSDSQVPIGSISPPQQLITSVEASENPPPSQQGLSCKSRRNPEICRRNNWHHPNLLRDLGRIIVSASDRMEGNDQSIFEPGIASVVKVPTHDLSKAKADRALQKLEEMVKAEFGDVMGATPGNCPRG